MSDWEVKDWRIAPKKSYADVFVVIALLVSATIIGRAMTVVPDKGGFDDAHIEVVAENRLTAVESLWVIPPTVRSPDDSDLGGISRLDWEFPTDDLTVRWVVDSFFKMTVWNVEKEGITMDANTRYYLSGLLAVIDEKFQWFKVDGTYCAWKLVLDGERIHFGSDTVEKPGHIPDRHWTVSHDYSGTIDRWEGYEGISYEAKLRFYLWFETEDPIF